MAPTEVSDECKACALDGHHTETEDVLRVSADRFPKRQHTGDWRDLVALILGVEHLTLLDVDKEPIPQEVLAMHRKVRGNTCLC